VQRSRYFSPRAGSAFVANQAGGRVRIFSILRRIAGLYNEKVTIQPYLARRLIILSFRAAARNLECLLMRQKPRIPRAARNDKVH
jgi:hypothetical protein